MDDWEKINETSLPLKENFYNHLNMQGITGADSTSPKKICKDLELKKLG